MLRNQRDELALGLPIIFKSPKKLRNGLERFPQSCKPLVRCRQLLGQILNGFHLLHKILVSTKPNQLSTSKLFFGTSLYLFSPIMTRLNRYLHTSISVNSVCLSFRRAEYDNKRKSGKKEQEIKKKREQGIK
jgi:hypothetical protein